MHAPDKKCALCQPDDLRQRVGLVEVNIVYDEHSAGPFEGFDLWCVPSDADLLGLVMKEDYGIDPQMPDARAELFRRVRTKKRRRERRGRRSDLLKVAIAETLAGVTASDSAREVAEQIRPYFHFSRLDPENLTRKVRRYRQQHRKLEAAK